VDVVIFSTVRAKNHDGEVLGTIGFLKEWQV
jgi:hypothetical protein